MIRVLHVAQPSGGGVPHAVARYAATTAGDVEHHLLAVPDVDVDPSLFASVRHLPRGTARRVRSVGLAVREVGADLVHAHSSFAGGYARLADPGVPVVYQPHCFVFDDPGRATWKRAAFQWAEAAMARRTAVTVALTSHEAALARQLLSTSRVMQVPNVADAPAVEREQPLVHGPGAHRVVMTGRISPQKDPQWFAAAARAIREGSRTDVEVLWLGDGDPAARAELTAAGVMVTGWLDPQAVMSALDEADVYLHSAAYEGFPLSLLEAWARDVPAVIRRAAWTTGLSLDVVETPDQAAAQVLTVLRDGIAATNTQAQGRRQRAVMTRERQRKALLDIYRTAAVQGERQSSPAES